MDFRAAITLLDVVLVSLMTSGYPELQSDKLSRSIQINQPQFSPGP